MLCVTFGFITLQTHGNQINGPLSTCPRRRPTHTIFRKVSLEHSVLAASARLKIMVEPLPYRSSLRDAKRNSESSKGRRANLWVLNDDNKHHVIDFQLSIHQKTIQSSRSEGRYQHRNLTVYQVNNPASMSKY